MRLVCSVMCVCVCVLGGGRVMPSRLPFGMSL